MRTNPAGEHRANLGEQMGEKGHPGPAYFKYSRLPRFGLLFDDKLWVFQLPVSMND